MELLNKSVYNTLFLYYSCITIAIFAGVELMALNKQTCLPCQGGTAPLGRKQAQNYLPQIPDWQLSNDATLINVFQ